MIAFRAGIKNTDKTKSGFFDKTNEIDKPSARWTKKKKDSDF